MFVGVGGRADRRAATSGQIVVLVSTATAAAGREASPAVETAPAPSSAGGHSVPAAGMGAPGRVDPAVVVARTAGDGALEPRVTRSARRRRRDGALVVERRTATTKSSTVDATVTQSNHAHSIPFTYFFIFYLIFYF